MVSILWIRISGFFFLHYAFWILISAVGGWGNWAESAPEAEGTAGPELEEPGDSAARPPPIPAL